MDEHVLIAALKQQKADAFSTLILAYKDRVYNTALSIVQHMEDAEDVSQEVFISIYQNIAQFRSDSKLSTWIYRIAVTKSLEAIRKRKSRQARNQELSEDATSRIDTATNFVHPGVQLENKEKAAILFNAISSLPDNQKAAFILHKVEGLSYADIGSIMAMSLSSVESLMFRAKKNLQKLLSAYYARYYE